MVFRNGLDRRDVEIGEQFSERLSFGRDPSSTEDGGSRVPGIEQDRPAILHVFVDLGQGRGRQLRRLRKYWPVDQREENDLVTFDIDAHGLARLNGRALLENRGQALKAAQAEVEP